MLRWLQVVSLITALVSIAGCTRVRPYERELLAHPQMQAAPSPEVERSEEHVREVREGTAGATGNPGGGCGCN